ncbi:cytochrome c biogenesis protein ResB [Williamsia herbipolensis]|uniref:cytochrome c biogenesis protein ResB n=1 Tax=Williamsia herbipolensis TaxID=1603258 RepID=UPI0005F7A60F|nr:cytochrome c biogenesis protein ResB [Williamsia herbipolensis]
MSLSVASDLVRRRILWPLRNAWRSLTSMRTALALLFLLAVAAVPGALFPQRDLNSQKTAQYIAANGTVGDVLDALQLFEVFSSVWFTAIYALLFISLTGCLTPRMVEHIRTLRAAPVPAPRNLARLPRYEARTVVGSADDVGETLRRGLRGWRTTLRTVNRPGSEGPDSATVVEISAEKGYLHEVGNLVFHFALLALLVAIAVGKMFGYEGTRILVADGQEGLCNNSTAVYDSFRAGSVVDGTNLNQFCIKVDDFRATYLDTGQPDMYTANVRYQSGSAIGDRRWKQRDLRVNDPLRVAGDRVYLLGHGFAPTFTVIFPDGRSRTQTVPFQPDELQTMMSSGAVRFDTPAGLYPDEKVRRTKQIALEGLFAPTAAFNARLMTSTWPAPNNPAVAVDVYQGDTGLDTGRPQNVFSLSVDMINQGRLRKVYRVNLVSGQQKRLTDGTSVRFDGYERWVSLQVSHDPAQNWVLGSAIVMLGGLVLSLVVRRRRVWARIIPIQSSGDVDPRCSVEVGGLARTDQANWDEGFAAMVDVLMRPMGAIDRPRPSAT